MSFVTVFTVGAMGFVLLVPLVMVAVLVLSHAQLARPRALAVTRDDSRLREPVGELTRAA